MNYLVRAKPFLMLTNELLINKRNWKCVDVKVMCISLENLNVFTLEWKSFNKLAVSWVTRCVSKTFISLHFGSSFIYCWQIKFRMSFIFYDTLRMSLLWYQHMSLATEKSNWITQLFYWFCFFFSSTQFCIED